MLIRHDPPRERSLQLLHAAPGSAPQVRVFGVISSSGAALGQRAFRTHRWSSDASIGTTGTLGSTEAPPAHHSSMGYILHLHVDPASRANVPAHHTAWRCTPH